MNKKYHGIVLGGNMSLPGGRNIAGFRLRSAAKRAGYDVLALDNSVAMEQSDLEQLLSNVVTEETKLIGVSTVWLNSYDTDHPVKWVNDSFFGFIKNKFPHVAIVAGGPEGNWVVGSHIIYRNSNWVLNGFSDVAFAKLFDLLSGKHDHGLIYTTDTAGKHVVDSNTSHLVINPDDIETELELEDGFEPHQPVPLEVSRGCIFRCSFCNHPFQGAKDYDSYIRTVDSLARELKRNYDLFGTTRYSIMDDTFNDSIEKLDRLQRAIEKAKLPDFKFMAYIKPELLVTKPEMIGMLKNLGIASGYVGIESLQPVARKAIKKGMDVNRILDAVEELNSSANSTMHASFIIGLPGDTLDDIMKTYEFLKSTSDTYFRSWVFQRMSLYYDRNLQGFSEMDKHPEKFGYTIIKKSPDSFAEWENEHMTSGQATTLANKLNIDSRNYVRMAGWSLPTAWHLGISQEDIDTKPMSELKLYIHAREANRQSTISTLKRFI